MTRTVWFGPQRGLPLSPVSGMPLVLWDKDSTLADTAHRQPMIEQIAAQEASWLDYSNAARGDGLLLGAATLLGLLMSSRVLNYIVSGANAEAEPVIRDWAHSFGVRFDGMILRAPGNHQPNAAFKVTAIRELRAHGAQPVLFVEDWADAARMITKETGLPCLVVNPCYPEEARYGKQVSVEGSV